MPLNSIVLRAALLAGVLVLGGCADDLAGPSEPAPAPAPTVADAEVIRAGLEAWRAEGAIQAGAACANCHAPDGLDLAVGGFSEAAIRRRTAPHLPAAEAEKIVGLVNALRRTYRLPPQDPREFRPFQPGGRVLPGATVAERDLAFARQVDGLGLFDGDVTSPAAARRSRDAWLALDARSLPIGIPLNRWSEDPDQGHSTIADWLPDLPRNPLSADARATLYALHDAYLADPADAQLWALLDALEGLTTSGYAGNGSRLMLQKYRAVLVAQHLFRQQAVAGSLWGERPSAAFFPLRMTRDHGPNPVWEVGDYARVHASGAAAELPPEVVARTSGDLRAEMRALKSSWFWAGWQFDLSLQRTSGSNSTKSAEYFTQFLRTDFEAARVADGTPDPSGYAAHSAFMITKKLVVENFDPALADTRRTFFRATYSNFHGYGWDRRTEPTDPARRALYRSFVTRSYRMTLYLLLDHVAAHGSADRAQWATPLGHMAEFFEHAGGPLLEHDRALVAQVRAAAGIVPS